MNLLAEWILRQGDYRRHFYFGPNEKGHFYFGLIEWCHFYFGLKKPDISILGLSHGKTNNRINSRLLDLQVFARMSNSYRMEFSAISIWGLTKNPL
jgi:hypothetical protein